MSPKIVFASTCKGRVGHLRQTLPRNLADNPYARHVVLDYNDTDGLVDYLRAEHADEIASGHLTVYHFRDGNGFHMAHAKNMAMRCAMLEGADIVVTVDADNYAGIGFDSYIAQKFAATPNLSFLTPDFAALPPPGKRYDGHDPLHLGRGFAGRLAVRVQDFVKVGGYDEKFDTWRGEDIDIIERLKRTGLRQGFIDPCYLNAMNHSNGVRFKEYPHAVAYENNEIFQQSKNATNTVVNYGRIGCGVVYRNWEPAKIVLPPLPTRVFGIGFQRTATTSLHAALQQLGYDSAHWKSGDWALAIWREMHRWGRSVTLERDYALCDNPIPLLFRELDVAYPGSKFVLTVRDDDEWVESTRRLWSYEDNPQRWTWDGDPFSHKVHGIAYGRVDFDAATMLARYRRHNAEVMEYFRDRPYDLLVMDMSVGAGWKELCAFLRRPEPDGPFPRRHKSGEAG